MFLSCGIETWPDYFFAAYHDVTVKLTFDRSSLKCYNIILTSYQAFVKQCCYDHHTNCWAMAKNLFVFQMFFSDPWLLYSNNFIIGSHCDTFEEFHSVYFLDMAFMRIKSVHPWGIVEICSKFKKKICFWNIVFMKKGYHEIQITLTVEL